MVDALARKLDEWETDGHVEHVVIRAEGKAFSVGGDIRHLYETRDDPDLGFFAREYRLNRRIHHYPKPYVALVDGLVMGGGAGISLHASHVVAGPRMAFAMPEVGIGFFPDVRCDASSAAAFGNAWDGDRPFRPQARRRGMPRLRRGEPSRR